MAVSVAMVLGHGRHAEGHQDEGNEFFHGKSPVDRTVTSKQRDWFTG